MSTGALRRIRAAGDPRMRPPHVRPGSEEAGTGGLRTTAEGRQSTFPEGAGDRLHVQTAAHHCTHAVLHRSLEGERLGLFLAGQSKTKRE